MGFWTCNPVNQGAVGGKKQKAFCVHVQAAGKVKVIFKVWSVVFFFQQVKNRLMKPVLVCAYGVLGFVHHQVDIFADFHLFIIDEDFVPVGIYLKAGVENAFTVYGYIKIPEEPPDVLAAPVSEMT